MKPAEQRKAKLPLRVGFIGFGTVARAVQAGMKRGDAGASTLAAALVRRQPVASEEDFLITNDREAFLSSGLDVVVELAGQEAVEQHGETVLARGIDFLVISVGALADDDLHSRLRTAAEANRSRLLMPSGAIAGLDAISSASLGGLEEVTITTRKPVEALRTGTDRDHALAEVQSEASLLYEGPARHAVKHYPANVNVAAALSLAGIGFDRTYVRVYADPSVTRNTHDVLARGWFGELRLTIQNIPTENPKTGRITALSVMKALSNLTASEVLVG
jgi:aspartate dehydrogenase